MKRTLLIIAIAATFAACSSKNEADQASASSQQLNTPDTTGLSAFQQWKEQQPIIPLEGLVDQQGTAASATVDAPKAATRIIYRDRPVRKQTASRRTPAVRYTEPEVVYTKPETTYGTPAGPTREAVSRTGVGGGAGAGTETGGTGVEPAVVTTPAETPVKKKEGWSKAAKGTVIGAATGAVVGAIVSKNKGLGAVIGGVVGGAGGYVIGRSKDKKDGRY